MVGTMQELSHDIAYTVIGMQTIPETRVTYDNTAYIRTETIENKEWLIFLTRTEDYPLRVRVPTEESKITGNVVTTDGELVDKVFSLQGYPLPAGPYWAGKYDFAKEAKEILEESNHPQKQTLLELL